MRTTTSLAALVTAATLTATLALASCSSPDSTPADTGAPVDRTSTATPSTESASSEAPASEGSPSTKDPDPDAPLLSVSIEGDEVLPNAEAIDLDTGEPLLIEVVSDRAGELHVHSKPEQFIEFKAGTTDVELIVDTPGSVEIEDHETSAVVALLQVR